MQNFSLLTGRNIIALAAIYKRNEIISFVQDFMNGMLNHPSIVIFVRGALFTVQVTGRYVTLLVLV